MKSLVIERFKAFAAAHRCDGDCQAYISASRCTSSVIAKAKAEAWQTTCSSLSPRSNPKSVHFLLCSIAGSPSSSSSLPNFPNCSSPRELASVYAGYLRSHFSVSQPKALHSRARGYLSELHRATCQRSLTRLFAHLSLLLNFLWLPQPLLLHCHWPWRRRGFCTFLCPFRMGLTNPGLALGRSFLLSISRKLLILSGISPFTTNLFRLASVLALLFGLNLFFLIGPLAWFIKITDFEPVTLFRFTGSKSVHTRYSVSIRVLV